MNLMVWAWLGAIVVFGVAELLTEGMVSIWFVVGSLAALVFAVLNAPLSVQMLAFVLVSAAALALSRPFVRRIMDRPDTPTNADRVLGCIAKVTETVDNERGAVYVDGKTWTARSADGHSIPAGEAVRVQRIEGVKLLVNQIVERTEAVK